ncbi:hypothetical protein BC941DRAFT_417093 [Chlamydoabsidia padenii]|nr:hypothetical protein BC941DRAFT_417093 [Chlamydoabsidia padenii]
MSGKTSLDVLTDKWVQKLHFENRVKLNLQMPASDESIKGDVGNVPPEHIPQLGFSSFGDKDDFTSLLMQNKQNKINTIPTSDSYLSSIVAPSKPNTTSTQGGVSCQGTSDCPCYKCQRQRRRFGTRKKLISTEPSCNTLPTTITTTTATFNEDTCPTLSQSPTSITSTEQPATPRPTVTRNGSFVLRKKPSSVSYERHLPRPTYSELDSIYREHIKATSNNNKNHLQQNIDQQYYNKDSYEVSWQDETGDDILTSLRTFQAIFEEKPYGSEGLSDLLEFRAEELRLQKIQEQQELDRVNQQEQLEPVRPPKRTDCLTLSYRDGPEHKHLTLYHTMKMTGPVERITAYGKALQHCIHADSGLASWIERQSNQSSPIAALSSLPSSWTLKKPIKRSLLQHLPGRKHKNMTEDLWHHTNKLTNSIQMRQDSTIDNMMPPIDVLCTANALMPASSSVDIHQSIGKKYTNKKPYDHVDTPKRPLARNRNSVDNSLASFDMEQPCKSTKSGKLWTSLGRKVSRSKSTNSPSTLSVDKVYHPPLSTMPESSKQALDKSSDNMAHVDPFVLRSYLEQSNDDYMKTLSVIHADVTFGRL